MYMYSMTGNVDIWGNSFFSQILVDWRILINFAWLWTWYLPNFNLRTDYSTAQLNSPPMFLAIPIMVFLWLWYMCIVNLYHQLLPSSQTGWHAFKHWQPLLFCSYCEHLHVLVHVLYYMYVYIHVHVNNVL